MTESDLSAPAKPLTLDDLFPTTGSAQGIANDAVVKLLDPGIGITSATNALAGALVAMISNDHDRLALVADMVKRIVQGVAMMHVILTGAIPVDGDAPANSNTPQARETALLTIHNREDKDAWLRILPNGVLEHGPNMTLDEGATEFFAQVCEMVRGKPMLVLGIETHTGELVTQDRAVEMLQRMGWVLMRVEDKLKLAGLTPIT